MKLAPGLQSHSTVAAFSSGRQAGSADRLFLHESGLPCGVLVLSFPEIGVEAVTAYGLTDIGAEHYDVGYAWIGLPRHAAPAWREIWTGSASPAGPPLP
jgi:hypothetical protein